MSQCLIFDYQDSFTYNIASELRILGLSVEVIPFEKIQTTYKDLKKSTSKKILVHGPGPGHPDNYNFLYQDLKNLLAEDQFFHLGICLGHQIMMEIQGGRVVESAHPIHGRKILLKIPEWGQIFDPQYWGKMLEVQRYNSLSLRKEGLVNMENYHDFQYVVHGDDVMMTFKRNQLTYQFHPESVGTSCPFVFFGRLSTFLYN